MVFPLPTLPYGFDALEPHISKRTLEYHFGKHHVGYANKLNSLIPSTPFANKSVEEIVKTSDGVIYNNAAQNWNHSFYWNSLAKNAGGPPTGMISQQIDKDFTSFAKFKEKFDAAASGHFGSGWAWLVFNKKEGRLNVVATHDAGCPIRDGIEDPILVCDVWEHAYYLDYQNDRSSYVKAWWCLVNWNFANKNLEAAMKK